MKQKTLKGSFSLFGKGLHTGLNLTVTFNPGPENSGYKIQRIDLEGQPVIDAIAENVIDTQRGTVLGKGDARISTVEHGLSALYALGIDNCLIQVNGPEFPILDGSAIKYVEKIQEVGVEEQNAPKLLHHYPPRRLLLADSHVLLRVEVHQQSVCDSRQSAGLHL